MTGVIYGEQLTALITAIGKGESIALQSITKPVVDGDDFAIYMGRVLVELRNARLAADELITIYEANKRAGNID